MFNYDYLFGDHFAKVSNQAKLLYIKMNFYATCGFVANPKTILDSMGYDMGVLQELIINDEVLTLPDRCEVFLTSYFLHNHNFKPMSWLSTPFAAYWKGKLFIKSNGVATFKKPNLENNENASNNFSVKIQTPPSNETDWDRLLETIDKA